MGTITSSKTIDSISIPGTHDSGCDIMTPWVQTQDLSIPRQLNMGIRYLDIRCRHINNAFAIHHGEAYLNKNFNEVLLAATQFLAQNPSETVLMRVKQEYDPIGNNRSFENTFKMYRDRYASFFWTYNNDNPTLGSIRGKIVVLQNFAGSLYGLVWSSFNIQDEYNVNYLPTKQSDVLTWYKKAGTIKRIINHLSGVGFYQPSIVANNINLYMKTMIKTNNPRYVGIVPMDFPGNEDVFAVIRANY
jgi:1-phosphatidylinositol phosphodiesterase